MSEQKMREALELADAALSGANMNMNVVMRKVKTALAQQPTGAIGCRPCHQTGAAHCAIPEYCGNYQQASAEVPDGYVLVPAEPTPEMLEASLRGLDVADGVSREFLLKANRRRYRAMLSAAPVNPSDRQCAWKQDDDVHMPDTYQGACGALWTFTTGGPVENNVGFCQFCGGRVHLAAAPEVKLSC
ncbi:MAG: hypothetical protein AABY68_05945 [Pseudomonadota bacterium]